MPDSGLSIIGTTDRTPVTGLTPTEKGLLMSLSAFITHGSTQTGRTHVLAGVTTSGSPTGVFHTVLIDDYVYNAHSPSWTGMFPLEPGDAIMGIVRSADAPIVRIVGRTISRDFPIVHLEP